MNGLIKNPFGNKDTKKIATLHYNAKAIISVQYLFSVLCFAPREFINCCASGIVSYIMNV